MEAGERSLSCCQRAIRRVVPHLSTATIASFLEKLRAAGGVTSEEAAAVSADLRGERLLRVLSRKVTDASFRLLSRLLSEQKEDALLALLKREYEVSGAVSRLPVALSRRNEGSLSFTVPRLSFFFQEALTAPPGVSSQSYSSFLYNSEVPDLPKFYLPQPALARGLRDQLLASQGEKRLLLLHGGPGMGKTLLAADIVRVSAASLSFSQ